MPPVALGVLAPVNPVLLAATLPLGLAVGLSEAPKAESGDRIARVPTV